jgi:hypothetical protein
LATWTSVEQRQQQDGTRLVLRNSSPEGRGAIATGGVPMERREKRRMAGMLQARLPELGLEQVEDRRSRRGRRWKLGTLLKSVVVGLCAGCRGLAELEGLTQDLEPAMRRVLGLKRRAPDTTLRDALVRVLPYELREVLRRMMKAAFRRKALPLVGLPFHAAMLDGKGSALPSWDHHYAQRHVSEDGRHAYGLLRTVTVTLGSTPSKPVLDAVPIPAETNEMGIFPTVFEALMRHYGKWVRLVTYDAGATCAENCRLVVEAGKDFLFRIKNELWLVTQDAKQWLGALPTAAALARTEDRLTNKLVVRRSVFLHEVKVATSWMLPGVKTVLRVCSEREREGRIAEEETEDRYYVSSLAADVLSPEQWLLLVRNHWAVENNCHWTFDAIFREDEHPWIEADPRGALVVMLLRRVAYNLLALFRAVTLRSEEKRQTPWRTVLRWVFATLMGTTEEHLTGLRRRSPPALTEAAA